MRDEEGYAARPAEELRAVDGPVDVVGHDRGAHLAIRVVSAHDVPVRSRVCDVAYGWHPDYRWHEAAALWQKSPEGERSLAAAREASFRSGLTFGDHLMSQGMNPGMAKEIDDAHDAETSEAALLLYRSATPDLHADRGQDLDRPTKAPGLVLVPTGDPMTRLTADQDMARRLGAGLTELDGLTHGWMLQDPDRVAGVLRRFWSSLPTGPDGSA
ncbi:alpha/beta fold hydrolase [Streptomyces atrovirens]|uniref:Alpha/beta fold hydrolase n=1 Tax=Streptomyces atrovirens TaxID=285556 RepID=A0ABW0DWC4_9ACTN